MDQWIRKINVIVDGGGKALDLSGLHIQFSITKSDAQTPNEAEVTIYNMTDETANLIKREFRNITIQAGYIDHYGVIFQGNIKQVKLGKENGTDKFLKIYAGDGDAAYNFAVVNTTLAAGATDEDKVNAATGAMGGHGASKGSVTGLGKSKLTRGKVMYGMARDVMRQTSESNGTSWSIQNGKVQVVPIDGVLPTQAVVLNSKSGLIGTPEQTNDGITAQCLLNPMLSISGRVKINNGDILEADIKKDKPSKKDKPDKQDKPDKPARITDDGFYKLLKVDYVGDTHGNDWYCNLVCLAINDTLPEKKVKA